MKDDNTVLAKSTIDKPFEYLLKLRTGEMIFFTGSRTRGKKKWLHLKEAKLWPYDCPIVERGAPIDGPEFPRGIDVRISDIVWMVDAPRDS